MTAREQLDLIGALMCVAAGALLCWVLMAPRPAPQASCAALYRIARTPADSLYIAVNRGDCAP